MPRRLSDGVIVNLLEQLVEGQTAFRSELTAETRSLRLELVAGLDGLSTRLDAVVINTGTHYRDLDRRLRELEAWRSSRD